MIVYKVVNMVNGKIYVGQTRNSLEWRKRRHLQSARSGKKTHFYNAIRKYGEDAFEFSVICRAYSKEELNRLETFYIEYYDSVKNGYNMVDGGDNNVMDIPEVKDAHSKSMRSTEVREKISNTMKEKIRRGEFFTEQHRKRLSESAKGNHNFGSGDTRSIGCFCIDIDGNEHHFHSYREAWKWWSSVRNVFDSKAECVYQRKIKQSIETGAYWYKGEMYLIPKWYREEVVNNEVEDKM